MSMGKRRCADGYDHDANCRRCKRWSTALRRAGVRAYAKRRTRRRERHAVSTRYCEICNTPLEGCTCFVGVGVMGVDDRNMSQHTG